MSEVCPMQTKRLRHVFCIRRPTKSRALKSRWILIRHIQNYTLRNCCPMFFSWWRQMTDKGFQPTDPRRVNADIISQWHNSAIGTAMEVLMPERNQFHTNAWGSGIAKEPLESFYRSEGRVTPSHFNSFRGHSATYPTAPAVGTATAMSFRKNVTFVLWSCGASLRQRHRFLPPGGIRWLYE